MKINNYMVLTGNIKAASWWAKMRIQHAVVVVFRIKIDIDRSYMQIEGNAAEERCPEGR